MTTTLPQFDPLLHQPLRTQIAAFLAARGEATFTELKQTLEATDGNLDAHMTKFIDAGYVKARKKSAETATTGRAQTVFSLTPAGRKALAAYIAQLHALMAMSDAAPAASKRLKPA